MKARDEVPIFGGISTPMVCQNDGCIRVAFHKNDGNHENDKKMKTTQTATNKELSAGLAEITEMTKTKGNPGCKPRVAQRTGLEIPES